MEMFVEYPGLSHIGKKVLKFSDFQSLLACRLVRKSWKNQIEKIASKIKLNVNDLENLLWIKTRRDEAFKNRVGKIEHLSRLKLRQISRWHCKDL